MQFFFFPPLVEKLIGPRTGCQFFKKNVYFSLTYPLNRRIVKNILFFKMCIYLVNDIICNFFFHSFYAEGKEVLFDGGSVDYQCFPTVISSASAHPKPRNITFDNEDLDNLLKTIVMVSFQSRKDAFFLWLFSTYDFSF